MAIGADTVWEIRQDATANNVNGGGFNSSNASPGTDRSQTTAAFDSGADLASTDGDANPTVVTSASHTFDSDDHGNIIHITGDADWTDGWYEIVSTAAGAATLDRSCSPTDGAISSGTWYLGGAMSLGHSTDDAFFEAATAGNKFWIKYTGTTIDQPSTINVSNDGTIAAPMVVEGYKTTRGDSPTGADRPAWGDGSGGNIDFAFDDYWTFKNIIIVTGDQGGFRGDAGLRVDNCKITYSGAISTATALFFGGFEVRNSEIISNAGRGISLTFAFARVKNCYIHDCLTGIYITTADNFVIQNNIISDCDNYGIEQIGSLGGQSTTISNNTFYQSTEGTSVAISYIDSWNMEFMYNIFYGWNVGMQYDTAAQPLIYVDYNAWGNNGTDVTFVTKGDNAITLTADPFTNAAGGDFSLNNTAGGGVLCRSITQNIGTGTSYTDIGALQVEPAATPDYPGVNDVRKSISFNSGANVGNLVTPDTNTVVSTVTFDSIGIAGTYVSPDIAVVIYGETYGPGTSLTGTWVTPEATQVDTNVSYGPGSVLTGTLLTPDTGRVINTVVFGPASSLTGTWVTPDNGRVIASVTYGDGSELTGTYATPDENFVLTPIVFGDGGEITGTWVTPDTGRVVSGITFGASSNLTGTWVTPDVTLVLPTTYGDGSEITGTYVSVDVNNVRKNIAYGIGTSLTGNLVTPDTNTVTSTVTFDAIGITGTYISIDVIKVASGTTYGPGNSLTGTLAGEGTGPAPVFTGITQLEAVGGGCFRATWGAGTGVDTYNVYVSSDISNVFNRFNRCIKVSNDNTEVLWRMETGNKIFLNDTNKYYAGIRAEYNGVEDTNILTLDAIVAGGGATYLNLNDIIGINLK